MNSKYPTFVRGISYLCFILCLLCFPLSAISQDSDLYKKLSFFLYSPTGETIEGAQPGSFWFVRVKDSERNNLPAHLEIPGKYNGPDDSSGDVFNLPVYIAYDFMGSNISSVSFSPEIKKIGDNCFSGCKKISSIVIPNSISEVGWYAFKECTSLSSVVVSPQNKVTVSFSGCDIKKGAYPIGKRSFGADIEVAYPIECIPTSDGLIFNPDNTAFYFAPWMITELELPSSVTLIGNKALAGCTSLNTLTIKSKTPPSIGDQAFENAFIGTIIVPTGSKKAYVEDENWRQFESIIVEKEFPDEPYEPGEPVVDPEPGSLQDGSYFHDDDDTTSMTLFCVISSAEKTCKIASHGSVNHYTTGAYKVPSEATVDGVKYKVISIGSSAYSYQRYITQVEVPEGIVSIDDWAFRGCTRLTDISLPQSLESVGKEAFIECDALNAIILPKDIKSIGKGAFKDCKSIWRAGIGGVVGDEAFSGCKELTTLDIRPTVEAIGKDAFKNCSALESVRVSDIEKWFKIDFTNEYSNPLAYSGYLCDSKYFKPIENLKIPSSITSLKNYCLYNYSGLKELTIPQNVTTIGNYVFANCSGLEKLDLGNPYSVGDGFLSGCGALATIELKTSTPPLCSSQSFSGFDRTKCTLLVPDEGKKAYFENIEWSKFNIEDDNKPEIMLDCTELTLHPNETAQLNVTIINSPSDEVSLKWSSSDERIVTVSPEGIVSAKGLGVATITVNLESVTANCKITVIEHEVTRIEIQPNSATLEVGESLRLVARAYPKEAPYPILLWTSTDPSVVEVNSGTGYITGAGEGVAEIKAIYQKDEDTQIYGECVVTIKPKTVYAATLSLNETAIELEKGEVFQLIANILPENTTDKTIIWSSADESVVTVDNDGVLTAVGKGMTTVTAQHDNLYAMCEVAVTLPFHGEAGEEFEYTYKNQTLTYRVLESEEKTVAVIDGRYKEHVLVYIPANITYEGRTFSVVRIENDAFRNYNSPGVWSIQIANGVKEIGERAFMECKLWIVGFPSTIQIIEEDAFKGCLDLYSVTYPTLESLCKINFKNPYSNPVVAGTHGSYMVGLQINDPSVSTVNLVIDNNITRIGSYVFAGARINTVTLGESVESIGEGAFYYCQMLTSVHVEGNLKCIPSNSFRMCTSLSSFDFKEGLEEIGDYAFAGCQFTTLTIPNTVLSIGKGAFRTSSTLENVRFGGVLKSIGSEAFRDGNLLQEVILPPSLEYLGEEAFGGYYNDINLSKIIIGPNIKSIGNNAFSNVLSWRPDAREYDVFLTAQLPPAVNSNPFMKDAHIYLQGDEAMEMFKDHISFSNDFKSIGKIQYIADQIIVNRESICGGGGDTFQLEAKLEPEDVTLPYIFWRSTNPEIATVDHNGLVTIHSDGLIDTLSEDGEEAEPCKIIAESLYANVPAAEVLVQSNNTLTGVEDIETGESIFDDEIRNKVEIYNLNGLRVGDSTENLLPGIYIVRKGNQTQKIIIP